jgi:hypothetical protein
MRRMGSQEIRPVFRAEAGWQRLAQSAALALFAVALATACGKPAPLTKEKAESLIHEQMFHHEPVYAEVPQRVWWRPTSPMDDYDAKALKTLQNLQQAGFLTVAESHSADGTTSYLGKVTEKGFRIIGTTPSARGPAFRGQICYKVIDGIRNFERHPNDPLVGRAELAWHYDDPTPLYPLFETKINKPLEKTFVSLISFYWKSHTWNYDVTVRKTEAE